LKPFVANRFVFVPLVLVLSGVFTLLTLLIYQRLAAVNLHLI
jgi:uncharacterized membrane protein YqhA